MNSNLLGKSKNCSIELEAWKAEKRNSMKGFVIPAFVCIAIAVYLIFGPDTDAEKSFLGLAFMVASLILSYFMNRVNRSIKNEGDYFSSLCNTEYLMVYEDKICGECSKGDLSLSIKQIDRVSHFSQEHIDKDRFYNDQLIIYDIVGNKYDFISFSNARELEMIIKNLLTKGE